MSHIQRGRIRGIATSALNHTSQVRDVATKLTAFPIFRPPPPPFAAVVLGQQPLLLADLSKVDTLRF